VCAADDKAAKGQDAGLLVVDGAFADGPTSGFIIEFVLPFLIRNVASRHGGCSTCRSNEHNSAMDSSHDAGLGIVPLSQYFFVSPYTFWNVGVGGALYSFSVGRVGLRLSSRLQR
jgi:hypothetical protein